VHHGIEMRAKGMKAEESVLESMKQYDNPPGNMRHDEALMEREIVGVMLTAYFWYWERPDSVPHALYVAENIAAEEQFELKIKGSRYVYAGKIDGIVRLGDGRTAIRETKTSSDDITPASDYVRRLLIDNQISGYVVAARKHRQIDKAVWQLPSVKSAANCAACHTGTDQGLFDDHHLKHPAGLSASQSRAWND
jgi:hypothetical protein